MGASTVMWAAIGSLLIASTLCDGSQVREEDETSLLQMAAAAGTMEATLATQSNGRMCNEVHPNASSPNMLHIVYTSNPAQIEGVQASAASVLASVSDPGLVTIHMLVQNKHVAEFKKLFGLHSECSGSMTPTGALVRFHSFDPEFVQKSVPKLSERVLRKHGAIDSIENYARFYMHLLIEPANATVVYLDADTIVQADIRELPRMLHEANQTIGFADRGDELSNYMVLPKSCPYQLNQPFKKLCRKRAFNAGVFVVDLGKWAERNLTERVEKLVKGHNQCSAGTQSQTVAERMTSYLYNSGGTGGDGLWYGGSQPPLLLALFDTPQDTPEEFTVFKKSWNTVNIERMTRVKLREKKILHWNGVRKPWYTDGLYRDLWLPHRVRFESLVIGKAKHDSVGRPF